ncbi:hypothetical protein GCM10027089_41140 [Nocardia thraciensis]
MPYGHNTTHDIRRIRRQASTEMRWKTCSVATPNRILARYDSSAAIPPVTEWVVITGSGTHHRGTTGNRHALDPRRRLGAPQDQFVKNLLGECGQHHRAPPVH